jgi:hypothetical protein
MHPPPFYHLKKPFVHILQQLCIARSLRLYPLQQSKSLPGQINVWRAAEGGQTDLQLRALQSSIRMGELQLLSEMRCGCKRISVQDVWGAVASILLRGILQIKQKGYKAATTT